MLKHIAITVNDKNDIDTFYKDLLGFSKTRSFTLPENLSDELFGIKESVKVVLLHSKDISLEVFLSGRRMEPAYNHICIAIQNRENIVGRAQSAGYTVTRVGRSLKPDLVFLKDSSGNSFELVDSE